MTYNELLQQKEWWSKCNEILSRDHYKCKDCGCLGFHNGFSYAVIDDISVINNLFSSWVIDGKSMTQFCSNIGNYDLEHFEDVKIKELEKNGLTDSYHLHFRLYNKNSKYFRGQPRGFHYGDFISNIACDKIGMDAIHLYDVISHKSLNICHSWLYAFKFEKELANKVYLSINGSNSLDQYTNNFSFGNYAISVNYGDTLVVLMIESTEEIIFKGLNIHHTYYIKGYKPWDYDNDALVTLCEDCHRKRHNTSHIPLYDSNKRLINKLIPCDRCGGSGYLPQYNHVKHGICFKCGGEGVILYDEENCQ